jgi:Fe2+ transport system protein FeoA
LDSFRKQDGALTLADLKIGQQATISHVKTADRHAQRLMVLGLVEGADLTFISAAVGGDPLEFRLYGAAISLRRAQAAAFTVELAEA